MNSARPWRGAPVPTRIRAVTLEIDDPGELAALLPEQGPCFSWIRGGEGFVASGVLTGCEVDSAAEADQWWRELSTRIGHECRIGPGDDAAAAQAGTGSGPSGVGPLALGSFTFDAAHSAQRSVLLVPRVIVGRRDGLCWMTRLTSDDGSEPGDGSEGGEGSEPGEVEVGCPLGGTGGGPRPPVGPIRYADGALSGPAWESVVARAVQRIRAGELDKVVLARDLLAQCEEPVDPRWLVRELSRAYERCWTFLVDDLVGATPEMLVRRQDGLVTSRVLAGTIQRTHDAEEDRVLAARLSHSSKDLGEHEYAVDSVARALAPYCSGMNVPDAPYVLELPNVFHLATDVTAVAREGASSLALAAALHPSAAVCGHPTEVARGLIREVEGLDRGRYAGPVGWVDTSGDGEWGIALRCGRISGTTVQLYAGCGIVADSDPASELAETVAKLMPMRDALEA